MPVRCYCGAVQFSLTDAPQTVAYCHCVDCKRWTGSPLPAFAAFADGAVVGDLPAARSHAPGVDRWNCPDCGSPLMAAFDCLPGQVYVPLGVLDNADTLAPDLHCHAQHMLPWLHLQDDLPRHDASGRAALQGGKP